MLFGIFFHYLTWEYDDLIVNKGSADEKTESEEFTPEELFLTKRKRAQPNQYEWAKVQSGSLSCRGIFCDDLPSEIESCHS